MDSPARNYAIEDIDRETVFHPNTSIVDHLKKGPHIVAQASGVRVRDRQGRDLIDAGAGLWCVNIGYGRQEMADAASKAIETLAYSHIFAGTSNEPIIRLAERVLRLLHEKAGATHLSKVFFGSVAQTQTTQTSSLCATTTTCVANRRRRSSSLGWAPTMA